MRLSKNQIDYYNRIDLNKKLRKISNEYNISFYKLKKFYNDINNNDQFDIKINIIEEKQIKYLLFQDCLVLA
jgi:hypothetical protein